MTDHAAACLQYLLGMCKVNPGIYSKDTAVNVLARDPSRWAGTKKVKDEDGYEYETAVLDRSAAEPIVRRAIDSALSSGQLEERNGKLQVGGMKMSATPIRSAPKLNAAQPSFTQGLIEEIKRSAGSDVNVEEIVHQAIYDFPQIEGWPRERLKNLLLKKVREAKEALDYRRRGSPGDTTNRDSGGRRD